MTDQELERKLHGAFEKVTPNVLPAVLSQCAQQKGRVIPMKNNKKNTRSMWLRAGSLAAALVLILGLGLFLGRNTDTKAPVTTVVSLDVNPSLELQLQDDQTVLQVLAHNEEAQKVLGTMDLTGSSLDVAVNALLGSMLQNGYLSNLSNSILVSVEDQDPVRSARVQEAVTQKIQAVLSSDSMEASVLSQAVTPNDALSQLAKKYGISLGKARLIQQIITQNTRYTFEDLVGLTVHQLNLLSVSQGHHVEGITASGTASDGSYIGAEAAKTIALNHAGLQAQDVTDLDVELDLERGVMIYEVEFHTPQKEYDYHIQAVDGTILKSQQEDLLPANPPTPPAATITPEAAKAAALNHAGLQEQQITLYRYELDRDDGRLVYEISFLVGNMEYEYDIDAETGAVVSWERELEDDPYDLDDDWDDDEWDDDDD